MCLEGKKKFSSQFRNFHIIVCFRFFFWNVNTNHTLHDQSILSCMDEMHFFWSFLPTRRSIISKEVFRLALLFSKNSRELEHRLRFDMIERKKPCSGIMIRNHFAWANPVAMLLSQNYRSLANTLYPK